MDENGDEDIYEEKPSLRIESNGSFHTMEQDMNKSNGKLPEGDVRDPLAEIELVVTDV